MVTEEKKNIENEIVLCKTIKAGKRIYYIDVKQSRNDDMFLTITESKRLPNIDESKKSAFQLQKHKIFLYREDFTDFISALQEAAQFVVEKKGEIPPRNETVTKRDDTEPVQLGDDLDINIDF